MWRRYLGAVDQFLPGCAANEREQRARLMLARDLALARMREAGADALPLWSAAHSIAARWAMSNARCDDLQAVRMALVRLALAAGALDALGLDDEKP